MKRFNFVPFVPVVCASVLCALTACNQSPQSTAKKDDHGHDHANGHGHDHPSGPPHGGTPVKVGEHDFHLELVNDTHAGKMLAYVFDDHMEHAETVPPTSFELIAKFGGNEHRATFNAGGGSKAATTNVNLFSATADWFKNATNFDGLIPTITLKGETFTNVTFTYPKGISHKH
jgi:hypothetical protein